ncbi:MAG: LLM class flavin-dependent oxidoreductase [Candidatus Rokubacteria bacterium]|nr:LLM class flavin-dependent oxidoreductase [Candidatus Rokubacteria bacterium]
MPRVKFGVSLPSFAWPDLAPAHARGLRRFAQAAEERGFDTLWASEHLQVAPLIYNVSFLSPLPVLAHVAGCTTRIRVGTAVLLLPLRNPVILAKEIATLDFLTEGRFVLGVGAGWDEKEFELCGVPLGERAGRLDECLAILRRLLTEEAVTFEGKYYRFRDVTIHPRPRRFPELWVGGGSKAADPAAADRPQLARSVLRRICREADVWISRPAVQQERILSDLGEIRAALQAEGRGPSEVGFAHLNFVHVVDTTHREKALAVQRPLFERLMGTHRPFELLQQCYFVGTPDDIMERIRRFQEAGLEYLVLTPLVADVEQLDLWVSKITSNVVSGRGSGTGSGATATGGGRARAMRGSGGRRASG